MRKNAQPILFLLFISTLVFLPHVGNLTYFKDDWYYIYDGYIGGAKIFHAMFSIDRPARGYFFELYYSLFGPQPLPYHLGAYVWRIIAGAGAFSIFNLLWKDRKFAFFTALLFTIYPGYFWWISAVEYQPMIASLALQVVSILLTLKSIQASSRALKIVYLLGAIITGWMYIALVDYAIGMEVFRFICVYILANRGHQTDSLADKLSPAVRASAWNVSIPLGFILWRVFLFNNERRATDIGFQLGALFNNPVSTLIEWSFQAYNSLLNLGVLAWAAQFTHFFFNLRLRDTAFGLLTTAIVLLLVAFAERTFKPSAESNVLDGDQARHGKEALLLGSLGMAFGILPVIMANRSVNIIGFSHYGLPASLAAAVFMTGVANSLPRARSAILYAVIAFASLAHYGIAVNAAAEEFAIQKFWWQASWRIPALRPGTTLVIRYPAENIGDDGSGVMEAPNMIYFPQPSARIPVLYNIHALTLSDANVRDVLSGKYDEDIVYRSHTSSFDYGNILVLSQPADSSCVHIIDGNRPLISAFDPGNVMLVAPSSNIENVIADAEPFTPQSFAFGAEPEHEWCYYYEKAELALQMGNWADVSALGEQAIRLGLHPEDQSEWLPFLYGYAVTGNEVRVKQTASKINADKLLRLQACAMLASINTPVSPEIQELISTLYCKSK